MESKKQTLRKLRKMSLYRYPSECLENLSVVALYKFVTRLGSLLRLMIIFSQDIIIIQTINATTANQGIQDAEKRQ